MKEGGSYIFTHGQHLLENKKTCKLENRISFQIKQQKGFIFSLNVFRGIKYSINIVSISYLHYKHHSKYLIAMLTLYSIFYNSSE